MASAANDNRQSLQSDIPFCRERSANEEGRRGRGEAVAALIPELFEWGAMGSTWRAKLAESGIPMEERSSPRPSPLSELKQSLNIK
jgi:hypothetical protein